MKPINKIRLSTKRILGQKKKHVSKLTEREKELREWQKYQRQIIREDYCD